MRGRVVALSALLALFVPLGPAMAAEPTAEEQALATTLFQEGKALLAAGQAAEACAKLGESWRIHPLGGTLLNLALCHVAEGKTASAWAEFREARVIADRDQRDDRLAFIDERMKELEPKLSKVTLDVPPNVALPNAEVRLDAREVRRPAWGVAIPVDPGPHVVEATAPGKKPWRGEFSVAANGANETVTLPRWEDAPEPAPPAPAPILPTVVVPVEPTPSRLPVVIAASTALLGATVGTVFGVRAIVKHNESDDACANVTTPTCPRTSLDANDAAKTAADISTVAFVVGIVGLGATAYLWFFGGARDKRSVRVLPGLGPDRATLAFTKSF